MDDDSKKKPTMPIRRGGLGRGLGALIPSGPLPGGSSGKGHFWNALDNPPPVDEEPFRSILNEPSDDHRLETHDAGRDETAGQMGSSETTTSTTGAESAPLEIRDTAVDINVDTPDSAHSAVDALAAQAADIPSESTDSSPPSADVVEVEPTETPIVSRETSGPDERVNHVDDTAERLDGDAQTLAGGDGHAVPVEHRPPKVEAPGAANTEFEAAEVSESEAESSKPLLSDSSTPDTEHAGNQPDRASTLTTSTEDSQANQESKGSPAAVLVEISPDAIRPNPKNPRQVFDDDELAELAESIKDFGLLQPIVVREQPDGYELVMGERRLRAAMLAGVDAIPVIVRQTEDDEMLRDALLENIHRVQLHPLEEAAAYQQLIDEFGVTHEELALRIKRSRPAISNTIRLLKLPSRVQNRVAAGVISGSHARALLSLDDTEAQEALATRIVAEGLSVRATEEAVSLHSGDGTQSRRTARRKRPTAPALSALTEKLSDHFDTRVLVQLGRSKGKIVVEFASIDDLERIVAMMAPPLATQRLTENAVGDQPED